MAILLDAVSVVVPVEVLEEKYPGGVAAYERDFPNGSFRSDAYLSALSFIERKDAFCVVGALVEAGLDMCEDYAEDIAVVYRGCLLQPCLWLEITMNADKILIASYSGHEADAISVPDYFDPLDIEASLGYRFTLTQRQLANRLEYIETNSSGQVFQDRKTGHFVRAGKPLSRH